MEHYLSPVRLWPYKRSVTTDRNLWETCCTFMLYIRQRSNSKQISHVYKTKVVSYSVSHCKGKNFTKPASRKGIFHAFEPTTVFILGRLNLGSCQSMVSCPWLPGSVFALLDKRWRFENVSLEVGLQFILYRRRTLDGAAITAPKLSTDAAASGAGADDRRKWRVHIAMTSSRSTCINPWPLIRYAARFSLISYC